MCDQPRCLEKVSVNFAILEIIYLEHRTRGQVNGRVQSVIWHPAWGMGYNVRNNKSVSLHGR